MREGADLEYKFDPNKLFTTQYEKEPEKNYSNYHYDSTEPTSRNYDR